MVDPVPEAIQFFDRVTFFVCLFVCFLFVCLFVLEIHRHQQWLDKVHMSDTPMTVRCCQ